MSLTIFLAELINDVLISLSFGSTSLTYSYKDLLAASASDLSKFSEVSPNPLLGTFKTREKEISSFVFTIKWK